MKFASADDFRAWLEREHSSSDGIWLEFAKKDSGIASVAYAEALQVALCFGWIDGQVKKSDDPRFYQQRWTPRRARSKWSQRNREFAEKLIASGAMQPAGLAEVERAKADGRWEDAYPSPSKIEVPDDFAAAMDATPGAREFFETLKGTRRYAFLYRIHDAKKAETRARRIAQFAEKLGRGETLN